MSSTSHISPVEELAEFIARRPTAGEIEAFQLSEATLERARELLEKNQNSTITRDESRELDQLIWLDDLIALIQLRATEPSSNGSKHADGTPGATQS